MAQECLFINKETINPITISNFNFKNLNIKNDKKSVNYQKFVLCHKDKFMLI